MQHIRVAVRQFLTQPTTTLAAIVTLGLGIGAATAVLTLVNGVMRQGLPYESADRLMSIGRGATTIELRGYASHRDVQFLRDHIRTCAPIAAMVGGSGFNTEINGRVSHERDRLVSAGYFEALGVAPQWGRTFTSVEDIPSPPRVVVLTEPFLAKHGLAPSAIVGQSIALGGQPYQVVGVIATRHTRPSDPAIFRPLGQDSRGGGQNLEVLCRLAEGATRASLDGELLALTEAARRENLASADAPRAYGVISRYDWEFGPLQPAFTTLTAAVVMLLLVAVSNTTGLLLVRATGRRREVAVRTALGASPGQVARVLVVEGLVLAGAAGVVGLLSAPLLVRGLLAVAPAYYATLAPFALDWTVVASTAVVCLLVGLAVSVPPLLEVLQVNLRDTLHDEGRGGTASRRTRWMQHGLIGAETAICAVLLVGAVLLLRTFINLVAVPTGVDSNGVITARMAVQGPRYDNIDTLVRFFEDGVTRLEAMPGITSAAVGASLPVERALNLPASFPDSNTPERLTAVNWRYVTPHYLSLLGIAVVDGRGIADGDRAGAPPVALVNDAFARANYGSARQAIGRRIVVMNQPAREIVGVVADTSGWTLRDAARPIMFVPLAQLEAPVARIAHAFFAPRFIVRTAGSADTARRQLEEVVRGLDPSVPFIEVQTLDGLMLNSVAIERFYLSVLMAFALAAVALAAVGVYASYSYAVAGRTPEIGVRLALGAAPRSILLDVLGQALKLGAIAIAVGLAAAAGLSRLLRSVLFNVSEGDPVTYAAVGLLLLATIALATLLPARRAARIDPLIALRR